MTRMSAVNTDQLLLPPTTRLIHIGPPKTGTTSVQSAFHTHRKQLRQYGVHYAGSSNQPAIAALAVTGGPGARGDRTPRPEDWARLTGEVRGAGDRRVVVSSEYFSHADDAAARRVVDEMEGGPVHVVVTLRPLTKVAPSQWQQFIQNGRRTPFDKWLARVFPEPASTKGSPLFWQRHAHGELVRRWADVVGPEQLTVVVADDREPDRLERTFEALVGLPRGVLVPEQDFANRSLGRDEVELVRRINQGFHEHGWSGPWSNAVYDRLVFKGAALQMKTGRRLAGDEARVEMPDWAVRRACERGHEAARVIASLGVRVVGDLSTLSSAPPVRGDRAAEPAGSSDLVRGDAAALAVLGAMSAHVKRSGAARTAAFLSLAGLVGPDGGQTDSSGMPLLPVDAAARAALAVISARSGEITLPDLEGVPSDLAMLAVIAGAQADSWSSAALDSLLPVAERLDVIDGPAGTTRRGSTPHRAGGIPIEKQTVENSTGRQLLQVVARRGARQARLRLRRHRG